MSIGAVDSGAKIDMSSELAIKVVKDQLKMQQQLAAAMTQPTMVYDANGNVSSVPPQTVFDVQM
jgi:hypothetical protein